MAAPIGVLQKRQLLKSKNMNSSPDSISQTIVITRKSGWQLIDWRELIEYRDLFYFLIKRDVLTIYKQTVLGFTWAIIRPVFSMIIFYYYRVSNHSSNSVMI